MQSRSFSYSAIMITAVLLSACGKGDSDLRAWIDDIKAKPGAQIDPLPVMAKFPNFEYAAQGMRDPFSTGTPEADDANGAISAKPPHPKEELERFPLDSLDMVGTLGLAKNMEALVKDPDGVVHRVHIGNYLGQNDGKVSAISEEQIDLVEIVSNGAGGLIERPATIALEDNK